MEFACTLALIAEAVGVPVNQPGEKEFQPLEERIKVFK